MRGMDFFYGQLPDRDSRNHSGFVIFSPLLLVAIIYIAAYIQTGMLSTPEIWLIVLQIILSACLLLERAGLDTRLGAHSGLFCIQLSVLLGGWILSGHFYEASADQLNTLYIQASINSEFSLYLKNHLSQIEYLSYLEADRIISNMPGISDAGKAMERLESALH